MVLAILSVRHAAGVEPVKVAANSTSIPGSTIHPTAVIRVTGVATTTDSRAANVARSSLALQVCGVTAVATPDATNAATQVVTEDVIPSAVAAIRVTADATPAVDRASLRVPKFMKAMGRWCG